MACPAHDVLVLYKHVGPRAVDQFGGHLVGDAFEFANCDHLVDQENRLVVGIDVVDFGISVVEQMHQCRLVERHLFLAGDHGNNLEEISLGRPINFDLVENPAQGRLIEDLVGVKVGGKEHEGVKRDLKFLT